MGVTSSIFNPDDISEAITEALQSYKDEILLLFDRYTLRDTGNLVNSGTAKDTDDGFEISYGADYAGYVYHNPDIEPRLPGTTSYWDETAIQSAEYADILKKVSKRATDILNNKK